MWRFFTLSIKGLPEVCLDDVGVLGDFPGCSLGDHLSVIQYENLVRYAHDQLHIMFDEQDGDALLVPDPGDEMVELTGFLGVHAGCGFVEQEQERLGGHGPGYLEASLSTVGKLLGKLVHIFLQAHLLEHPIRGINYFPLFPAGRLVPEDGPCDTRSCPAMPGHHHVLQHGHLLEKPDVLEGARQAVPCDDIRLEPVEPVRRLARGVDDHVALCRLIHAGDTVEECRLAGAVGPYQGHDLALVHLKADVIKGAQTPEIHNEPSDVEHRNSGGHFASLFPSSLWNS